MSLGISIYNKPIGDIVDLGRAAEATGFDALWLGEHVLSCDHSSVHPMSEKTQDTEHNEENIIDPSMDLVDPWVTFGAVAAVTTKLKLATGIYLLPLRHPLITARHMISLQELSHERFFLGTGSGWIAEEFAALDIPFEGRGKRMDETMEILKLAAAGEAFEYHGEVFDFPRVQLSPGPVSMPIIAGGNTEVALRRAARLADGWFSSGIPYPDDALRLRDRILGLRDQYGKSGPFTLYFRIPAADPALIEKYHAEGITDLIVWSERIWPDSGLYEERLAALSKAADNLGLQAR